MSYDEQIAAVRRDDGLDDVRVAAVARSRRLAGLLEHRNALRGRGYATGEDYDARRAADDRLRDEIRECLDAATSEDRRAAALTMMVVAEPEVLWEYMFEVHQTISSTSGWTPAEVAVLVAVAVGCTLRYGLEEIMSLPFAAAEQLDAEGCRTLAPHLRLAERELERRGEAGEVDARARRRVHGRIARLLVEPGERFPPPRLISAFDKWERMLRDRLPERAAIHLAGWLRTLSGPIARAEAETILALDHPGRERLAEIVAATSFNAPSPGPGPWGRAAALAEYTGFGRRALNTAADRVTDLHSGKVPYVAEQAFTDDEVRTLGRVARIALLRDEPWLAELLERLLPLVAVAPTAAKTLPSQALLYEIARAVEQFPTPEAVAALREARGVVRHKGVPKQLDRMLKRIDRTLAERADVAFRLPDLGFGPDGTLRTPVGDHVAVIMVADDVDLCWQRADGSPLRGVPAAVRRDHADAVKELRAQVKRVRAHLTTITRALESGCHADTVHRHDEWRDNLADHPLGGPVVQRLIWEIETAPGHWQAVLPDGRHSGNAPDDSEGLRGGGLIDVSGAAVPDPAPEGGVRLWHPIRAAAQEIRSWRELMTERQIRQPFKQAFREIYRLTPAELETRAYSNRFAAHIVHYRMLYALFKGRGWKPDGLLGGWDGGHEAQATRVLGEWRAGFFHEYADYAGDLQLAATDQVRFERRTDGEWREAPLAEVPAVVFSEAMRDVDLFVGVTSIAADPEWADRGEDRYTRYWRMAAFGELTASAQLRREALERILPRTRIAARCSLDGRFLTVRGDLRTYRIHLGSSNILMAPDDAYLCIVPSRGTAQDQLFLPFEDDRLGLILSKAFLLADDANITDISILTQIRRS